MLVKGTRVVDVPSLIRILGFTENHDVLGKTSIAALIPNGKRCGIYVLHFSNGQFYVGQSVDVARRYQDHRKNHIDIAHVSFREVERDVLDAEEERTIRAFEAKQLELRNIDIVTWTYAKTPFNELMPIAEQNRWLEDLSWVDDIGQRALDLSLRDRTAGKLTKLRAHPFGDETISVARRYVRLGVPAIRRGEQRFWTITAMPSPSHILSRLSINEQEVMTLFDAGGFLGLSLHTARIPLRHRLRLTRLASARHRTSIQFTDHRYKPGGEDQSNIEAYGQKSIDYLLRDREVQLAVRKMNMRLSRRGKCFYSKSHCMDLATLILGDSSS